jgi:hypothetical protein
MKKFIILFGFATMCLFSSCDDLFGEEEEDDITSNSPGFCNTAFVSPSSDPQIYTFCAQAYNYRCNGYALTSQEVSSNCLIYKSIQDDNPGVFPDCQYCK